MMLDNHYLRDLFILDVKDEAKCLVDNSIYLKLYWNGFGSVRYQADRFPLTFEEKEELLEKVCYRGYPVPKFMQMIDELYGEEFLTEACNSGVFCRFGFDVFLADYLHYMASLLFGDIELPQYCIDWMLSPASQRQQTDVPLPRMSVAAHAISAEVRMQFDISTLPGALGLLGWTLRWKIQSIKCAELPQSLVDWLSLPAIYSSDSQCVGLTRFHECLFWHQPAEEQRFSLDSSKDVSIYCGYVLLSAPKIATFKLPEWVSKCLTKHTHIINNRKYSNLVYLVWQYINFIDGSRKFEDFIQDFNETHVNEIYNRWKESISLDKIDIPDKNNGYSGVNLIGWPKAEIGIGEDVRCAAHSFNSVGFPFVVIDAAHRCPPKPKPTENEVSSWISDNYTHELDVIYLDAVTQHRYYAHERLKKRFLSRKLIAVCPWELPYWPQQLGFVLEHLDHFWAASKYIKDAFQPFFDKEIDIVKPAVIVPEHYYVQPLDTKNEPFTYITIFDGLSSIHRKNPFATINAFKLAFAKNQDVRLIIKMMNLPNGCEELSMLNHIIKGDSRIRIISETLSKEALWHLVSSSHAFVSLHRSEGFGRNLAESMLLGRPVICSEFSGNLDFCFEDNSYLVQGERISVQKEHYSNSQGQYWFDASVEHAAEQILSVYDDYDLALNKAGRARHNMLCEHSYKAVGEQYIKLIKSMHR